MTTVKKEGRIPACKCRGKKKGDTNGEITVSVTAGTSFARVEHERFGRFSIEIVRGNGGLYKVVGRHHPSGRKAPLVETTALCQTAAVALDEAEDLFADDVDGEIYGEIFPLMREAVRQARLSPLSHENTVLMEELNQQRRPWSGALI